MAAGAWVQATPAPAGHFEVPTLKFCRKFMQQKPQARSTADFTCEISQWTGSKNCFCSSAQFLCRVPFRCLWVSLFNLLHTHKRDMSNPIFHVKTLSPGRLYCAQEHTVNHEVEIQSQDSLSSLFSLRNWDSREAGAWLPSRSCVLFILVTQLLPRPHLHNCFDFLLLPRDLRCYQRATKADTLLINNCA